MEIYLVAIPKGKETDNLDYPFSMGIPRLISTLEPYAVHQVLDNKSVVIDGPALAYHILYICNRHGIPQPSYKILGKTAVAWLDELTQRNVVMYA